MCVYVYKYIQIGGALCIIPEFSSDCSMKISVAWKIVHPFMHIRYRTAAVEHTIL